MKPLSYQQPITSAHYPPKLPPKGDVVRLGRESQIVTHLPTNSRGDVVVAWEGVVEYDKRRKVTKGVCSVFHWADKKRLAARLAETIFAVDADDAMDVG
jgi:hypothetical protein